MLYTVSLLYKRDSDFSAFDVVEDKLLFKICILIFLGTAYFHQKECLALGGNIANWFIPSSDYFFPSAQWVLCSPQPLCWHAFISAEAANLVGWGWFRKCRDCRTCLQVQ